MYIIQGGVKVVAVLGIALFTVLLVVAMVYSARCEAQRGGGRRDSSNDP